MVRRPLYRLLYEGRGVHDAITIIFPLNPDAESSFILHAGPERPPFGSGDVALAASSPLSPAERKVMAELLTEAPEKEIARRLGLATTTVHQYVISLYRKYGVKGRAGLMSLWLNRGG